MKKVSAFLPVLRSLGAGGTLVLALTLVAGCTQTTAIHLKFDTEEAQIQKELLSASLRVISRHAEAMKAVIKDQVVEREADTATVRISMDDTKAMAALSERLLEPFTLRLLRQVSETDTTATLKLAGHGAFAETGLTEKSLAWVYAGKDEQQAEKGKILLVFTEEGRTLVKKIFRENKGKTLGLFIRGILVSKIVSPGEAKDQIIIDNIPTIELAEAFADNVNVGMHVTFSL